MKRIQFLCLSAIVSLGILGVEAAQADTYQAGEFTISITGAYHYHGCDRKGNCIDMDGVKWRDKGEQGLEDVWENGDYTYWMDLDKKTKNFRLRVFDGKHKIILNRQMILIKSGV